ncbi:MAG: hypothetical protein BGO70_15500 [Bacteroidetes bacterium 43-93]|nr:acyltransferase [Bacteroidota bacterium]OJX01182.1 MAG: hypothetical protein BGO70_15500 [Bacteroidetes bacterium 43-93]
MKKQQINALTATRGFAALLIVIFHFGLERFPINVMQPFFTKGNIAVSYFFVLSGFIMCWTYQDRLISYSDYIKRRVARIVPLYWFALAAYVAFFTWQHFHHALALDADFRIATLLNIVFLQAYFPHYALLVNGPGWSLSVEMLFYLTFPFFLAIYNKHLRWFYVITITVFALSQALHIYFVLHDNGSNDSWHNFIYYHPLWHINEFLFGMMGCHWFQVLKQRHQWLFPFLLFALMVVTVMYAPPVFHNGLMAPLVLLFIISVAVKQPRILGWKPLVFLGEISYGIYILQFPVYAYWEKLSDKLFGDLNTNAFFYSYLIVLIVVSAICYSVIEQPLRRKINELGKK